MQIPFAHPRLPSRISDLSRTKPFFQLPRWGLVDAVAGDASPALTTDFSAEASFVPVSRWALGVRLRAVLLDVWTLDMTWLPREGSKPGTPNNETSSTLQKARKS